MRIPRTILLLALPALSAVSAVAQDQRVGATLAATLEPSSRHTYTLQAPKDFNAYGFVEHGGKLMSRHRRVEPFRIRHEEGVQGGE